MTDFNPPIGRSLMMLDERGRYFIGQFNAHGEDRYSNISCCSREIREIVAWGEFPEEDDPRWIRYDSSNPPGKGQTVLRVDYGSSSGSHYYPYFDSSLSPEPCPFPGFMGCPRCHDESAKAWIPVEQLELPFRMPEAIRQMRPRVEIHREAKARDLAYHTEAMVLTVINDGPTYRRLFEPLCQRGRQAFFTAKGQPRELLMKEIRRAISRVYEGRQSSGVFHKALYSATREVFDYYVQHADELLKFSRRPAQVYQ